MKMLATILVMSGLFTSRQLIDPPAIPLDATRNAAQLYAATVDAVNRAGWKADPLDRNTIRATFNRGQHVVTVILKMDQGMVALSYESSTNLAYEKNGDGAVIHKAYMDWTQGLMRNVQSRLSTLCPDLTPLLTSEQVGLTHVALTEKFPIVGSPERELTVLSSSGADTGYTVREYKAYLAGSSNDCDRVSAVFYRDEFVYAMLTSMEAAALLAYADVLNYLVEQKQISFSDAEMERMSLKVDVVTPLDAPRREELLRYVEWQAQRFDRHETTKKEYEYLVAQKEAEVQERQSALDQKEQELGILRRQQAMQSAALGVQKEQLAAQRSLAIGQALSNLGQALTYRPTIRTQVNCRSYAVGNTVNTTCN